MRLSAISKAGLLGAVVSVLLVGCASSDGVPPAAFEDCKDDALPTLTVKARVADDAYRHGQVARFNVLVKRAVQADDQGDGASQELTPVEGADVALGATIDEVRLTGGGTTNADGRTTIKLTVENYVPAGVADVIVSATAHSVDAHCVPYETGRVDKPGFFRVIR